MSFEEFKLRVQMYVHPDDFRDYQHLLDIMEMRHYENFLNCLIVVGSIFPAFKVIDSLLLAEKETGLSPSEFLHNFCKLK